MTQVQVFTPQEYVAGCGEYEEPTIIGDCGAGIAESPYEELKPFLYTTTSSCQVTFKGSTTQRNWNKCNEKHTFKLSELTSGNMDIDHISHMNPTWYLDNPQNLFGYVQHGAAHIFYVDLDNISSEFEKLPMS